MSDPDLIEVPVAEEYAVSRLAYKGIRVLIFWTKNAEVLYIMERLRQHE